MMNDLTLHEDGSVFIPGEFDQLAEGQHFTLKRLEDRPIGEGWALLYYGASGAGKTYFCGTAGPRTLFLNIGEGIDTLKSPAFTMRYPDAKKMIVIDLTEKIAKRGEKATEAFDIITDAIDFALAKLSDEWDTCVVDDATYMRRLAMNKALNINAGMRRNQPKEVIEGKFEVVEVQDYGREMQIMEWFLITYIPILKANKKNFVMTAHDRNIYGKPERIGEPAPLLKTVPGFTGKTFPDQIPAYFDDVFRAEVVGGDSSAVYRARTAGNEVQSGKARHGGIFQTVEPDPNHQRFLTRIKNNQPHPAFEQALRRKYPNTPR